MIDDSFGDTASLGRFRVQALACFLDKTILKVEL